MATSRPIGLIVLMVACGFLPLLPSRPAVAGGFWWQHGNGQTVMMAQPSTAQVVTLVPANTTTHQLQFSPFSHLQMGTMTGLRLAPANTAITAPGLTLSAGSPTTYYVVQQGVGSASAPVVAPQAVGGSRGLKSGAGGVTDQDYQILTTGLGGSFLSVQSFEQFLANELDKLMNQSSGLNKDQLTTLLLDAAKAYLTSQGFGFLLDPTVDAIITRLIGKVFQDRQASRKSSTPTNSGTTPPNGGNAPSNGSGKVPSGGFTFTVSGQVVLTPANVPGNTPTGNVPGNTPTGNVPVTPPTGTLPLDLTPAESNLSPPAPPAAQ